MDDDHFLKSDLYIKPMRIVYPYYIINPTILNLVRGVSYSQMLTYRRIITDDQIFFKRAHHLRVVLGRSYRDADILLAMRRAYSFTQSQLLIPKIDTNSPILPFVTPYDYNLPHFSSLRQYWSFTENDQYLSQIFQVPPFVPFQRNHNFKDHVSFQIRINIHLKSTINLVADHLGIEYFLLTLYACKNFFLRFDVYLSPCQDFQFCLFEYCWMIL